MVVLIDYEFIYKIVYHSILNTISTDRANRRLTNASVYLSVYQLDVHYILGRLNFVPDVFSCFYILGDDIVCEDDVEPVLDAF